MLLRILDYEIYQPHYGDRVSVFRYGEYLGSFACSGPLDSATALAAIDCIKGLRKGL